jgi:hypothetical protein
METVQVPSAAISGQVMLYKQPELLSRELHSKLGVNPPPNRFSFAASAHICPITVPEFGPASLSYPIIFIGDDKQPVVVFGLGEGQNLFATPEVGFEFDAYVPAFVRRYPFVLAQPDQPEAAGEERLLVGIDRGFEYVTENAQFPFFDDKGEPTEYTQRCIQFCNDFEAQVRLTRSFVDMIKSLDLLDTRTATYQPQNTDGTFAGPVQNLAEYFAVSEEKLKALPAAKLAELRDNGALQQIYAHINSLNGWDRLIVRALARQSQAPVAANA